MSAPTGRTLNHQNIECSVVRGCRVFIFTRDNLELISPQILLTRLTSLVVVVLLMCTSLLVSVGR